MQEGVSMGIEDRPSEAEYTNMQSEAIDTQKMVDEGLLSNKEASEFDYQNEMEIPEALLSKPPKISEKLREHVISKFPADSFLPENIAGTVVHGTSIRAIKPTWLGEGKIRSFGASGDFVARQGIKHAEGAFRILGDFTKLDKNGFNYVHPGRESRRPGFFGIDFRIFLVTEQDRNSQWENVERKEELDRWDWLGGEQRDREKPGSEYVSAVVLAKNESSSASNRLALYEKYLGMLEAGEDMDIICRKLPVEVMKVVKEPLKEGEELNKEIFAESLNSIINKFKNKIALNNGEESYQMESGNDTLYLTINQESNYIAHCMVQGVDKSKTVPIYDWDGNLLWPKEEDVKEENGPETDTTVA